MFNCTGERTDNRLIIEVHPSDGKLVMCNPIVITNAF